MSQINASFPAARIFSCRNERVDGRRQMHQIADKAEIAIDFPDKFYRAGFGRDCAFEARAESDGMLIRLVRSGGEKRIVEIHLHHFLFANILDELTRSLAGREAIDDLHRQPLLNAARSFAAALERAPESRKTAP